MMVVVTKLARPTPNLKTLKSKKKKKIKIEIKKSFDTWERKPSHSLSLSLFSRWHFKINPRQMSTRQWLRNDILPDGWDLSLFLFFTVGEKLHLPLTFLFKKCKW